MKKTPIFILLSISIFLFFQISFVSAAICKGSDGYFHDCTYTYTSHNYINGNYQKTVINLGRNSLYDSRNRYNSNYNYNRNNQYDSRYDRDFRYDRRYDSDYNRYRNNLNYDRTYYRDSRSYNRNVIYIRSSNRYQQKNYKNYQNYNTNKKYYYSHPYLNRQINFFYQYDRPRDYPTYYLTKYSNRDYKYQQYNRY